MDVSLAVRAAIPEFDKVFTHVKDVRLEEVVMEKDGNSWEVTVSFEDPNPIEVSKPAPGSLAALLYPNGTNGRHYKTIRVNDQDGKVVGISNPK